MPVTRSFGERQNIKMAMKHAMADHFGVQVVKPSFTQVVEDDPEMAPGRSGHGQKMADRHQGEGLGPAHGPDGRAASPHHNGTSCMAGGFSEEAMQGLDDLEARLPPANARSEPAFAPTFRMTDRLRPEVAAGGGLLRDERGTARPHYWGHRDRLRTRFLEGGPAAMPDYELLELLLFNAIAKIDVKPLAKRLLATFGDLNGVIAASEHRILQVDGADRWVYLQLRIVEAFAQRMAQARLLQRDVIASWDALISYCRTCMAHREIEQFRVIFLDRKNIVIADEALSHGTVSHVPVFPREVAKRALELNASAVILVHNHPSGDPTPSPHQT